jgi:hypothetical protein
VFWEKQFLYAILFMSCHDFQTLKIFLKSGGKRSDHSLVSSLISLTNGKYCIKKETFKSRNLITVELLLYFKRSVGELKFPLFREFWGLKWLFFESSILWTSGSTMELTTEQLPNPLELSWDKLCWIWEDKIRNTSNRWI